MAACFFDLIEVAGASRRTRRDIAALLLHFGIGRIAAGDEAESPLDAAEDVGLVFLANLDRIDAAWQGGIVAPQIFAVAE
jgi:hypothetical protein